MIYDEQPNHFRSIAYILSSTSADCSNRALARERKKRKKHSKSTGRMAAHRAQAKIIN